ncbi:UL45 thymidylate synthase [Testudinid alphaherpesvirus 3]|nr:UL45 thymidylate synthase [Testudinid alphaherpesvirus 3]
MALPPCHVLFQFYVTGDELSCLLYQRSADLGLGVPFNIASYALLVHVIAKLTHLRPGELVHSIGDAHIYVNHIEGLREQLTRVPMSPPQLKWTREFTTVDEFDADCVELCNYNCHPTIRLPMAV